MTINIDGFTGNIDELVREYFAKFSVYVWRNKIDVITHDTIANFFMDALKINLDTKTLALVSDALIDAIIIESRREQLADPDEPYLWPT